MVDHVHVSLMCSITYIIVYIRHLYSAYICTLMLFQCMAFFPRCCKGTAWIGCYKKHPPYANLCTKYSHNERVASWNLPISFYFYTKKTAKGPSYFYLFLKFVVVCCFSTLMVRLIVKCVNSNLVRFSERTRVNSA